VACPLGGSFTFGPSDAGEEYTFEDCSYLKGFTLNGSGGFDYGTGLFSIEAEVSGDKSGTLTYTRNARDGGITVNGEYGGETVDLQQ
jgi:hypothetical protein